MEDMCTESDPLLQNHTPASAVHESTGQRTGGDEYARLPRMNDRSESNRVGNHKCFSQKFSTKYIFTT